MSTHDSKAFVLAFFRARGDLPGTTEAEWLACEYLDGGVIDSMGIVEMILVFEQHFGIRFTPEHMQSLEFRTIGGIVQLIERLLHAQPQP